MVAQSLCEYEISLTKILCFFVQVQYNLACPAGDRKRCHEQPPLGHKAWPTPEWQARHISQRGLFLSGSPSQGHISTNVLETPAEVSAF